MFSSRGLSKLFRFSAGKLEQAVLDTGGATILYLEQDQSARAAVTLALRRTGYAVVEASTTEEGLDHARRFSFDLFLLSISLMDGWGIEFCRHARNFDRDIPVFFFSADFGRIHRADAPAPECFLKPPSTEELRHNIARLIVEFRTGKVIRQGSSTRLQEPRLHCRATRTATRTARISQLAE